MAMSDKAKDFWKRFFINIPFVLIVALTVFFFGAGALLCMYSIIIAVAWKSAMAYLIIAGGGALCIAAALGLIVAFKKYHKFYEKKMGLYQAPAPATKTYKEKKLKDYFTLSNCALAIALLGSVLTVVSAFLGAIERQSWVDAKADYMQSNGYYADIRTMSLDYPVDGITGTAIEKININLTNKNAVVIYKTKKSGFISIEGYETYVNQIACSYNFNTGEISIAENEKPNLDGALEKLLFFVFDEYAAEGQIRIYIPSDYKDIITINGEHIVALD